MIVLQVLVGAFYLALPANFLWRLVTLPAWIRSERERELKWHADYRPEQVVSALESFLSAPGAAYLRDEFDLFLAHPIRDPRLESIRMWCLKIMRDYPDDHDEVDCRKRVERVAALLEVVRQKLASDLQRSADAPDD